MPSLMPQVKKLQGQPPAPAGPTSPASRFSWPPESSWTGMSKLPPAGNAKPPQPGGGQPSVKSIIGGAPGNTPAPAPAQPQQPQQPQPAIGGVDPRILGGQLSSTQSVVPPASAPPTGVLPGRGADPGNRGGASSIHEPQPATAGMPNPVTAAGNVAGSMAGAANTMMGGMPKQLMDQGMALLQQGNKANPQEIAQFQQTAVQGVAQQLTAAGKNPAKEVGKLKAEIDAGGVPEQAKQTVVQEVTGGDPAATNDPDIWNQIKGLWDGLDTSQKIALGIGIPLALVGLFAAAQGNTGAGLAMGAIGGLGIAHGLGAFDSLLGGDTTATADPVQGVTQPGAGQQAAGPQSAQPSTPVLDAMNTPASQGGLQSEQSEQRPTPAQVAQNPGKALMGPPRAPASAEGAGQAAPADSAAAAAATMADWGKSHNLPFQGGTDPNAFDEGDATKLVTDYVSGGNLPPGVDINALMTSMPPEMKSVLAAKLLENQGKVDKVPGLFGGDKIRRRHGDLLAMVQ